MSSLVLLFATMTQTFALPPGLISALCFVESSHRAHVIHKDDGGSSSTGLCQIKQDTAKLMGFKGKTKDLLNPNINAFYASKYLAWQIKRYDLDYRKAVAAYNSGSYKTNKLGTPVNQKYVDKVFKAWAQQK